MLHYLRNVSWYVYTSINCFILSLSSCFVLTDQIVNAKPALDCPSFFAGSMVQIPCGSSPYASVAVMKTQCLHRAVLAHFGFKFMRPDPLLHFACLVCAMGFIQWPREKRHSLLLLLNKSIYIVLLQREGAGYLTKLLDYMVIYSDWVK